MSYSTACRFEYQPDDEGGILLLDFYSEMNSVELDEFDSGESGVGEDPFWKRVRELAVKASVGGAVGSALFTYQGTLFEIRAGEFEGEVVTKWLLGMWGTFEEFLHVAADIPEAWHEDFLVIKVANSLEELVPFASNPR